MNYRGEPHLPPQQVHHEPAETERGGGVDHQLVHRLGAAASPATLSTTLSPGAGSWQFNSIESRARHGLAPTHVPQHGDLVSDASQSEAVSSETTPAARGRKVTIPPQYKDILNKSEDYKRWLHLKNNFLRKHKKLKLPKKRQNLPKSSGNLGEDYKEKFPNFPGSYGGGEAEARPERESLESPSPGVFKEGGTLYRGKSSAPGRKVKARQRSPAVTSGETSGGVTVSSLRTTGRPATTYSSPLYPNTPFYSSPQPPLPPGYELVPVDQLTDDHEVVPWEDLPHLMRKHNMVTHDNFPHQAPH